jgi:hypothetical protein
VGKVVCICITHIQYYSRNVLFKVNQQVAAVCLNAFLIFTGGSYKIQPVRIVLAGGTGTAPLKKETHRHKGDECNSLN